MAYGAINPWKKQSSKISCYSPLKCADQIFGLRSDRYQRTGHFIWRQQLNIREPTFHPVNSIHYTFFVLAFSKYFCIFSPLPPLWGQPAVTMSTLLETQQGTNMSVFRLGRCQIRRRSTARCAFIEPHIWQFSAVFTDGSHIQFDVTAAFRAFIQPHTYISTQLVHSSELSSQPYI